MTTETVVNLKDVKSLSITQSRWDIWITFVDADGKEHKYVASADSFYTDHDRIWFGTQEEYENYH